MINTDKIMRTTKILLHGRHINQHEADDYLELIAEIKRLREGIKDKVKYAMNCLDGDSTHYNISACWHTLKELLLDTGDD